MCVLQTQFVRLSKTLYSVFHGDEEEESLYRAVARVTSLLLRMEEAGRKLQENSPTKTAQTTPQTPPDPVHVTGDSDSVPTPSGGDCAHKSPESPSIYHKTSSGEPDTSPSDASPPSPPSTATSSPTGTSSSALDTPVDTPGDPQEDWSFSFEQILASLLNEPAVVRFFERTVNTSTLIEKARKNQLTDAH